MAWMRGLRPCLAEPPAESPSTMKISLSAGSLLWQSASVPGRALSDRAPLRRTRSRALRAASRARAASTTFSMMFLASLGFSSRNMVSFSYTSVATRPATSELPSLVLVWPSNCGNGQLHADHGGEAFAHILAGQLLLELLGEVGLLDVGVQRAGERGLEARQVGAALDGADVVGEALDVLLVALVVLHRDLGDHGGRARRSRCRRWRRSGRAPGSNPGSSPPRRSGCRPRTRRGPCCRCARRRTRSPGHGSGRPAPGSASSGRRTRTGWSRRSPRRP